MIYRSNLTPPDMGAFKLRSDVVQNCGHDCPSDPDFEPMCTFMTHDEIAILYEVMKRMHRRTVIEIGSRFGWSAKAINAATAGCVICLDPILQYGKPEFERFRENLGASFGHMIPVPKTSQQFFLDRNTESRITRYSGFVIDGNHDTPEPLNDAKGCLSLATEDCVMVFHDGRGKPIQDAVAWLMDQGFSAKFYCTPNGMFVCWRGFAGWTPPVHDADPAIDWRNIVAAAVAGVGREGVWV